jgi:aquaporin Z
MTMGAARRRWREYAMEAALLATFMVSAVGVTALLQYPASAVRQTLPDAVLRRSLIGVAMGLTAAAIIYSPWGRRSGAHINPSITLTYLRLRKVTPRDAAFYVAAQFLGAVGGLTVAGLMLPGIAGSPEVNYVATLPGPGGTAAAFVAEATISFGMMTMILAVSNTPRLARFTGALAAVLVALYISVESPISGMSMNPARSFAPAVATGSLHVWWVYVFAPLAGMLGAAEIYVRRYGYSAVRCAKLHHAGDGTCHFNCLFAPRSSGRQAPGEAAAQATAMHAIARQP